MAEKNFETKMNELQEIVEKMEDENTGLEEAISLYEKGLQLAQDLQKQLSSYQEKITKLQQEEQDD